MALMEKYTCDVNPTWDWHALGSGTKRSTTWYAEGGSSTYGFVRPAPRRIWKGKQLDISAFNLDEVQDWNYPYKTDGAGIPVRGLASPTWQANGWHLPDDGFVCNNDEPPCEVDDPPATVPDTSFTLKWWHPRSLTLPLFGYSRAEWAALTGDPHITGAHGDHADIKGADGGIYSLLSTQRLSLAVRFEHADFTTPYSKQLVHGSWVRAAFWVLRLGSGELLRVAYDARHRGKAELEVLGGGGRRVSAHTLGKGGAPDTYSGSAFKYERGGVGVALDTKKHVLTVRDRRWLTTVEATDAKPHPKQLRMNVKISKVSGGSRMVSAVAPHGLLGQGFDGDGVPLNGRQDTYEEAARLLGAHDARRRRGRDRGDGRGLPAAVAVRHRVQVLALRREARGGAAERDGDARRPRRPEEARAGVGPRRRRRQVRGAPQLCGLRPQVGAVRAGRARVLRVVPEDGGLRRLLVHHARARDQAGAAQGRAVLAEEERLRPRRRALGGHGERRARRPRQAGGAEGEGEGMPPEPKAK